MAAGARRLLSLALALWLALAPSARSAALHMAEGQPGLRLLTPEALGGVAAALAVRGDRALSLLTGAGEAEPGLMTLWDLAGGKPLARLTLPWRGEREGYGYAAGFLQDGSPYLIDLASMTLSLYDQQLKRQRSFTPPGGALLYEPLVSPAGDWLWAATLTGEQVLGFPLAGGEARQLRSPLPGAWRFAGFGGLDEGALLAMFRDEQDHLALHRYEPATGRLSVRPVPDGFSFVSADGWLHRLLGPVALFARLSDQARLLRLGAWREGEFPLGFAGDLMLSQSPGSLNLRLYDLGQGLLLGELSDPPAYTLQGFDLAALSEGGRALLSDSDHDALTTRLYLWDARLRPLDTPVGLRATSFEEMAADSDQMAGEIAAEHGVGVCLREAGASFSNPVYRASPCLDEAAIARTLEALRDFLGELPPGLLAAALTPPYERLSFYLSGPILPRDEEGIRSAAGLSAENGDERLIIIDATEADVRGNLAHELMHLLEDGLVAFDHDTGGGGLAGFEALSPPDWDSGGYNWGYRMPDGQEMHETAFTAQAEGAREDPQRVYYADAYSRSLPMEDRARLFELLFTGAARRDGLLDYPPILRKARYLAALLRRAFPLIASPPPWEEGLSQPPDGDWTRELGLPAPGAA